MPSALGAITHAVSAYLSRHLLSSASCSFIHPLILFVYKVCLWDFGLWCKNVVVISALHCGILFMSLLPKSPCSRCATEECSLPISIKCSPCLVSSLHLFSLAKNLLSVAGLFSGGVLMSCCVFRTGCSTMDGGDGTADLVINKRFVSEAELEERRKRRQEEWEKVRKPEDPEGIG